MRLNFLLKQSLPLDGIKVLDLTRVLAGPYGTMMLGDLGAAVIKVEAREGDDTRRWGPPYSSPGGQSAYFLSVNRNKRSLTCDLKKKEGQELIRKLAMQSDVLVENFLPGKLHEYGLGWEDLMKINPKLIFASISGYGQDGPYSNRPGYDVIIEGEAGLMHITGHPESSPVKVGVAVIDLTTGLYTKGAILASLFARERTGRGQRLDISLLDCQVASLANIGSNYLIGGQEAKRMGTAHGAIVPYETFKTLDGYITIGAGNDAQFSKLCKAILRDDLLSSIYQSNALRVQNRVELIKEISSTISLKSTKSWLDVLEHIGIPFGPVNNIQQTFEHPQVIHRKIVTSIEHPTSGTIKLVNCPVKYDQKRPNVRLPPPLLGEHTKMILEELGYTPKEIQKLQEDLVV